MYFDNADDENLVFGEDRNRGKATLKSLQLNWLDNFLGAQIDRSCWLTECMGQVCDGPRRACFFGDELANFFVKASKTSLRKSCRRNLGNLLGTGQKKQPSSGRVAINNECYLTNKFSPSHIHRQILRGWNLT